VRGCPLPLLLVAAQKGHPSVADALVEAGADPDQLFSGYSLLEMAAEGGCLRLVQRALADRRRPPDINLDRAYHAAALNGHADVLKALGADDNNEMVKMRYAANYVFQNPVLAVLRRGHAAAAEQLVKDRKAAVERGLGPLLRAAVEGGCAGWVRQLLGWGADPGERDAGQRAALSFAWSPATVRLLLGAKASPRSKAGSSPLQAACERLQPGALALLLEAKAHVNQPLIPAGDGDPATMPLTPLAAAASAPCAPGGEARKLQVVDLLLAAGALPVWDGDGLPPISCCARGIDACAGPIAKRLCAAALALPQWVDGAGVGPLADAARHCASDVVEALLAARADPNKRDGAGWTPLMHAAGAGAPLGLLRQLVDAGADPRACDEAGRSVLFHLVAGAGGREGELAVVLEVAEAVVAGLVPVGTAEAWRAKAKQSQLRPVDLEEAKARQAAMVEGAAASLGGSMAGELRRAAAVAQRRWRRGGGGSWPGPRTREEATRPR
jgi:ankyrin repeat protein